MRIAPAQVGLCMIVRDEAAVIARCLESVRSHIQHWTIVDTGSTDGTRELAAAALDGVPGELHRHDWVDFADARTHAVTAAKGTADYLLVLDADDTLHGEIPAGLTDDAYMLTRRDPGGLEYRLPLLIRGDIDWAYRGAVHEHLVSPEWVTTGHLDTAHLEHHHDGGAKDGRQDMYLALLKAAVALDPTDGRSVFYLAQTLRETGDWQQAIAYYRLRLTLGGWDEEMFYSRYQLGCLLTEHVSIHDGAPELLTAAKMRPGRVEPLRALANAAHNIADQQPLSTDTLFVHTDLYRTPAPPRLLKRRAA